MIRRDRRPLKTVWAQAQNRPGRWKSHRKFHFYVEGVQIPICDRGGGYLGGPILDDVNVKNPELCKRCLRLLAFGFSGKRRLGGVDFSSVLGDRIDGSNFHKWKKKLKAPKI